MVDAEIFSLSKKGGPHEVEVVDAATTATIRYVVYVSKPVTVIGTGGPTTLMETDSISGSNLSVARVMTA